MEVNSVWKGKKQKEIKKSKNGEMKEKEKIANEEKKVKEGKRKSGEHALYQLS